jgi:mono/diheme cytochrome c family protein
MTRRIVAVCVLFALAQGADSVAGTGSPEVNWTSHGGAADEANYSPLEQINSKNVARLGLAWSLELVGETSLEATPLAIDGVLYFTGSSADVYAVDAANGKALWLLRFALDAHGTLPSSPPRDLTVTALDDPTLQIDPLRAKSGLAIYQGNCAYCHGRFLVSPGGPAPDLRESPIALNWSSFLTVVKDGALLEELMPGFRELSEQQLSDLYLYIRSGSRQILQAQKLQSRPGRQSRD